MQIGFLLVVLLVIAVALGTDGKRLALEVNVDVLLAEAWHICFNEVCIPLILYIGTEALNAVAEEATLHIFHFAERIVDLRRFAIASEIRCKFKHGNNTSEIYNDE